MNQTRRNPRFRQLDFPATETEPLPSTGCRNFQPVLYGDHFYSRLHAHAVIQRRSSEAPQEAFKIRSAAGREGSGLYFITLLFDASHHAGTGSKDHTRYHAAAKGKMEDKELYEASQITTALRLYLQNPHNQ